MNPLIQKHQSEIEKLCRRFCVKRLELFGSAAAGKDVPGKSDLDFLVEFQPMATGGYADAYFGLAEALSALFARPVDLVVASTIENPYFLESVTRSKALLYAA